MAPDAVNQIKELEASRDIMIMYTSSSAQHSKVSFTFVVFMKSEDWKDIAKFLFLVICHSQINWMGAKYAKLSILDKHDGSSGVWEILDRKWRPHGGYLYSDGQGRFWRHQPWGAQNGSERLWPSINQRKFKSPFTRQREWVWDPFSSVIANVTLSE